MISSSRKNPQPTEADCGLSISYYSAAWSRGQLSRLIFKHHIKMPRPMTHRGKKFCLFRKYLAQIDKTAVQNVDPCNVPKSVDLMKLEYPVGVL